MKLFKKKQIVTLWVVDDDTMMPIICDDEKAAREIVEKDFDGEEWRIYTVTEICRS